MKDYETATIGKRLLAYIIDFLCIAIIAQLLLPLIFGSVYESWFHIEQYTNEVNIIGRDTYHVLDEAFKLIEGKDTTAFYADATVVALSDKITQGKFFLAVINYGVGYLIFQFIIPLLFKNGVSLGKKCLKLKVVKKDGSEITIVNLLLRSILGMYIIECVVSMPLKYVPFFISCLLLIVTKSKRSLHDYIAGTIVVQEVDEVTVSKEEMKKEATKANPYHKKYKGFEFIDVDALEEKDEKENSKGKKKKKHQKDNKTSMDEQKDNTNQKNK